MARTSPADGALRYVALGDSYTIGTGVTLEERWPNLLVAGLGTGPPSLDIMTNLGVNGYTSRDLIRDQLPALAILEPEFVSLLIGVNDVVRGVTPGAYEANVVEILDTLLRFVPSNRIVTVAIPDYTVTPAGADYGDPHRQHDGIVENNRIMAGRAADRGIAYVDIFDLSLRASGEPSLVAEDGLHPSGRQYAAWVERIQPVVERLLGR